VWAGAFAVFPANLRKAVLMNIQIPEKPSLMASAIVAYAGIAKRLHAELSDLSGWAGVDLDAIRNDLISEAKKAVPHGDFARDELEVYETMFEAIDTIFDKTG
jgi:hypothetical protein